MNKFANARILIFAKAPIPGEVKTRLIPTLGAARAAGLQTTLIENTVTKAVDSQLAPVQLWCSPDARHPVFRHYHESAGVELHVQQGGDLGERMRNALDHVLATSSHAVLIGCDCPEMSVAYLDKALQSLEAGAPAVLGPAHDGGYVLIGLRKPNRSVFDDIAWGTSEVLQQTRDRLSLLGWSWKELEPLRDLDWPEDLAWLVSADPEVTFRF